MPKSKVRKKTTTATATRSAQQTSSATAPRIKVAGPTSPLYLGVMLGLMILGLLWIVVFYLWGRSGVDGTGGIPLMRDLDNWNLLLGFALMIAGLLMAMRWR